MATAPHKTAGTTSTPAAVDTAARLPQLDGLRSLVILVLIVHFADTAFVTGRPSHGWAAPLFALIRYSALVGMEMFFVLSGFLITGILLRTRHSPTFFRAFYARRFLRIFPLYYGSLLVFFVALPRLFPVMFAPLRLTAGEHAFYWTYLTNFAPLFQWSLLPGTPHLWSLAVEEQFYLVWPFIVFVCSPARLRRVCLACVMISITARLVLLLLGVPEVAVYTSTFTQLDALAFGALLALAWRDTYSLQPFSRWLRPATVASTCAVVFALFVAPPLDQFLYVTAAVSLGGSLVVSAVGSVPGDRWHRVLMSPPIQRLGKYSYGIYVLHFPIATALAFAGVLDAPSLEDADHPLFGVSYAAAAIPICVLAGALSWHLFEEPILRLRRYFPYEWNNTADGRSVVRVSDAHPTAARQAATTGEIGVLDARNE